MSQSIVFSEVSKDICEALGCFAKATAKIEVKVGQSGVIMLSLCDNCVSKFADN